MGAKSSRYLQESLEGISIGKIEETKEPPLGEGSYGKVVIVKVNRVRCACKKLHELLVTESDGPPENNPLVQKFVVECKTMSRLRHPNIVQFMGVHIGQSPAPYLIMELLPTSVGDLLDKYPNIPKYLKNSILRDVALGLLYLHTHNPPIIHRDLTVNNVLLTSSLQAKITDLGQARVLESGKTSLRSPLMTICPGNVSYMPPEACVENPVYNSKLDVFSFGHMIIYIVIQKWPMLLLEFDELKMTKRTEVQRREQYIEEMGRNYNSLRTLAVSCLLNNPKLRPTTEELVKEMEMLCSETPLPFSKPEEFLKMLAEHTGSNDDVEDLKQQLSEKTRALAKKERKICTLQQAIESKDRQLGLKTQELEAKNAEIERLKRDLSSKKAPDAILAQKVPTVGRLPPTAEPVPIPRKRMSIPPNTADMDKEHEKNTAEREEEEPKPVKREPKGIRRAAVPSPQGMDPKLAERFARQRQKIAENAPSQAFQELEASQKQLRRKTSELSMQRDRVAIRKSPGERELTPELQQWLSKRRSKFE